MPPGRNDRSEKAAMRKLSLWGRNWLTVFLVACTRLEGGVRALRTEGAERGGPTPTVGDSAGGERAELEGAGSVAAASQ